MIDRICLSCGRRFARRVGRSRCPRCSKLDKARRNRDAPLARRVVAEASVCAICGLEPRPNDPLTMDHRTPVSVGGSSLPRNVRAVHRSCNAAKRDGS